MMKLESLRQLTGWAMNVRDFSYLLLLITIQWKIFSIIRGEINVQLKSSLGQHKLISIPTILFFFVSITFVTFNI